MQFIPKSLRNIFFGKAIAASISAPVKRDPLDELKPFLQEEGYYLFNLEIERSGDALTVKDSDMRGFHPSCTAPKVDLMPVHALTQSINFSAIMNFDLESARVFFKKKGANLFIDGMDETIGLPVGDGYQIVLIPQTCGWTPPAAQPQKTAPGICGLLQPPR